MALKVADLREVYNPVLIESQTFSMGLPYKSTPRWDTVICPLSKSLK